MQIRLMQSASLVPRGAPVRPLDKDGIAAMMKKFKGITETSADKAREEQAMRRKKNVITQTMRDRLEMKFEQSIRDAYKYRKIMMLPSSIRQAEESEKEAAAKAAEAQAQGIGIGPAPAPGRIKLTTRALLPYYTLDDVVHFMETFSKVDEDFSGDLDINEWVRLFSSINAHMSEHESRMIFMKIDKNGDGFVNMRELVPIIFSRATKAQQKMIIDYSAHEMVKKHDGITYMTPTDMEQLFECYDVSHIGYVSVALLRERVQQFGLSEPAWFLFLDNICGAADDEMVNQAEFSRLLKSYIEKTK